MVSSPGRLAPLAALLRAVAVAALLARGSGACTQSPVAGACPAGFALTVLDASGCCQLFTCAATNDAEVCAVLGDLYFATNGNDWAGELGWSAAAAGSATDYCGYLTSSDADTFLGDYASVSSSWAFPEGSDAVSCDPQSGALTSLQVSSNRLTGTLPASLGLLTDLESLTLTGNQLSGTLPASLGSLTALTHISMSGNQLSGSIPAWLGALTRLEFIDLSVNSFTGSIPPGLANLTALTVLGLDTNPLSGTIPAELGRMSSLRELTLFRMLLSGPIPDSFASLTNLYRLTAYQDQLSGTLPAWLGSLTSLGILTLGGNRFSGTIPPELGSLTALEQLQLHQNQLTGSIPPALGALTSLWSLQLQGNQLSGALIDFSNMTALAHLDLHGNQLSGAIAPSLGSLGALNYIDLSSNSFSGPIPPSLGNLNLTVLQRLDMSSNSLTGTIPDELSTLVHASALTTLRLDSNRLSGAVPAWVGEFNSSGLQLGLANNWFSSSTPPALLSFPFNVAYRYCSFDIWWPGYTPACTFQNDTGVYEPIAPVVYSVPGPFLAACPAGSWRSGGDTSVNGSVYFPAPICSPCAAGTVAPLPGSVFCTPTPPNTFALNDGINYQVCPEHSTSPQGSTSVANCSCAYGFVATTSAGGVSFSCEPCAAGTYFTAGACAACPPGTSAPQAGATSCSPNPPGFVSTMQTTFAANVTLAGVSAAVFTASSNGTLAASIAAVLAVPADSVTVTSVTDPGSAGRRLLVGSACAAYTVATTNASLASAVRASLGATSTLGASLATALQRSSDAALSQVASVVAATPSETSQVLAAQPCPAGTFLNAVTQACESCGPGLVALVAGSTSCLPCPSGSYANGTAACSSCPPGAMSQQGADSIRQCLCPVKFYQAYAALNNASFSCAACPDGALCSGDDKPLALDGFWHFVNDRTAFYECEEEGYCNAEVAPVIDAPDANCHEGHTGLLCGECLPGWAMADFCIKCPHDAAFAQWPKARLAGVMFIAFFLFSLVTVTFILADVIQPGRKVARLLNHEAATDSSDETKGEKPQRSRFLRAVIKRYKFCQPPIRMVVENLQIISSFKRTMHITWPPVFNSVVKRLSMLNFNFLRLPSSACNTPSVDFYSSFNGAWHRARDDHFRVCQSCSNRVRPSPRASAGITISVAACLVYVALLWITGLVIMRAKRWTREAVIAFNRRTLRRVILFLTLTYAPVTETVLAVYSCRLVGSDYRLRHDVRQLCDQALHKKYTRLAGWWVAFYLVGVPAAFSALLWHYNIPQVAGELKRNTQLCSVAEHAHRCGVAQPVAELHTLTTSSITADHVDILYRHLILDEDAEDEDGGEAEPDPVMALKPRTPLWSWWLVRRGAKAVDHDEKLRALLAYAQQHLRPRDVTWLAAEADDPRLEGAKKAVGQLYDEFYADRWYGTTLCALLNDSSPERRHLCAQVLEHRGVHAEINHHGHPRLHRARPAGAGCRGAGHHLSLPALLSAPAAILPQNAPPNRLRRSRGAAHLLCFRFVA